MDCLFPFWKTNTQKLVRNFISEGFKTLTCCVRDACLDLSWCGKLIDEKFIADLPTGVDPCGEKGNFTVSVLKDPSVIPNNPFLYRSEGSNILVR
jgi:diphthamide synthase (EF-2-diphthine--ammonia ligase)